MSISAPLASLAAYGIATIPHEENNRLRQLQEATYQGKLDIICLVFLLFIETCYLKLGNDCPEGGGGHQIPLSYWP